MACWGTPKSKDPKSQEIDVDIKNAQKQQRRAMKILFLGTGDSGKSTFTRQLANLAKKLTTDQINGFATILRQNCLDGAQTLIKEARVWKVELPAELNSSVAHIMEATNLDTKTAEEIHNLSLSPFIQKMLDKRGDEIQFQGGAEGVKFFFSNATRFAKKDFVPTFEETLKARIKTSGVIETVFEAEGVLFTLVDVGGQRSERKKWLHCFSQVTAIIFLAAINEYDMLLEEDTNTNRLVESLKLWKALSSSDFFFKTPFILFLNKSDLFKQKIETVPLSNVFNDWEPFTKRSDISKLEPFDQGWRFLATQYENHFGGSSFYAHVTCALDTDSCRKVWESVRNEILRKSLHGSNL